MRADHSRLVAVIASGGMIFATPLAFYVWAHGSMSHAISFFVMTCAGLTLERFLRDRGNISAFVVGCWCGMIFVVRAQDATWAIVLMAVLVGNALCASPDCPANSKSRKWLPIILASVGFALALLPQMAVWKILYGGWLTGPTPYLNREGGNFSALPIHLFSALFSGRHGALSWHPILIGGLVGLGFMVARGEQEGAHLRRWMAYTGLAGFVAQLWLVGCWSMWWAGASFGNRFFISSYPFLFLGLACLLSKLEARKKMWIGTSIIVLLVAWNAGLAIQYGTEMIPREDPVSMMEIIINQFTEVPNWLLERIR